MALRVSRLRRQSHQDASPPKTSRSFAKRLPPKPWKREKGKGNELVEIDVRTGGMAEGELVAYLVQSYRPGESAAVTVVRGGRK